MARTRTKRQYKIQEETDEEGTWMDVDTGEDEIENTADGLKWIQANAHGTENFTVVAVCAGPLGVDVDSKRVAKLRIAPPAA